VILATGDDFLQKTIDFQWLNLKIIEICKKRAQR
jgi:hypothetical protein